jgi:hypothetical protein
LGTARLGGKKYVYDVEEALLLYDPEYPSIVASSLVEDAKTFSYFVINKTRKGLDAFPPFLPYREKEIETYDGDGIGVFFDFGPNLKKAAYDWTMARKLDSFGYMSLFYVFTQLDSSIQIGRRVLRHLGMMRLVRNDGEDSSSMFEMFMSPVLNGTESSAMDSGHLIAESSRAKEQYVRDNYTFQGEYDQDFLLRLINGGLEYFSPVGRDNYIRKVEGYL